MYADRYQRSKPNPISLTAAVGINAALVAALLFSAPEIAEQFERPFEAYSVPDDPLPPPPPPPEPARDTPSRTTARDPLIVTPIPKVPTTTENPVIGTTIPQPPLPPIPQPGPDAGTGTGVTVDPPKPAPVLVDAAPDPRADFQPEYPPSERRAGLEGVVTIRVQVGTDGRVKAVELVRSASDAFFQATRRQALSRWRFTPATRDGVPYESWRTMTVRFRLDG